MSPARDQDGNRNLAGKTVGRPAVAGDGLPQGDDETPLKLLNGLVGGRYPLLTSSAILLIPSDWWRIIWTLEETSVAPSADCTALRPISALAADCSSTAAAVDAAASSIWPMTSMTDRIEATLPPTAS